MAPFDIEKIFEISSQREFDTLAMQVFDFQARECSVYREYLDIIECDPLSVRSVGQIPMLPIELFKSRKIYSSPDAEQIIFTSSATTGMTPAKHHVADVGLYVKSFRRGFERFYGMPEKMGIYGLLPNYLEREGSSLIYMFENLISSAKAGGFYLYDTDKLLSDMASFDGPKLLIGVSYALLDLAEKGATLPPDTMVMETGGMKGRRKELSKNELHRELCSGLGVDRIHSEYGMAELLSQAYSSGGGIFTPAPWLSISIRDLNDPFLHLDIGHTGGVDIIDLANIWSCSFIQTRDLGVLHSDGNFSLSGRISGSDIRGCNLLVD